MGTKIDMTGTSVELMFMLKLLRRTKFEDEQSVLFFSSNLDWNKLSKTIQFHRMYPVLYMELKKLDLDWIPPWFMERLKGKYERNVINMLRLCSDLEKLNKQFRDSGIPSLHLKGPVLARKIYGDISLRTSKDLDILVSPEDVRKAEEILLNLGYTTDVKILNVWKWKSHHISYNHSATQTEVELHWRINPETSGSAFHELWKRRNDVVFSSQHISLLGNEDLFVYLVTHGSRHGWMRLRWLYDIDQMLRTKMLDFRFLKRLLQKTRSSHLVGQALLLSNELLGTPIPDELATLVQGERALRLAQKSFYYLNHTIEISPEGDILENKDFKRYVYSSFTGRQKIQYLINRLYPSSKDALLLPLPKPLRFLYFPLRPFLWAWRQMRRQYL